MERNYTKRQKILIELLQNSFKKWLGRSVKVGYSGFNSSEQLLIVYQDPSDKEFDKKVSYVLAYIFWNGIKKWVLNTKINRDGNNILIFERDW